MKRLFLIVCCLIILNICLTTVYAAEVVEVASVKASSFEKGFRAENAIDGRLKTRWSSEWSDPQWIMLDFGKKETIGEVVLYWETAHAKSYQLQVSNDGKNWYIVYYTDSCQGGKEVISFKPVKVRYIRMFGIERKTGWGYSLFEFKVFSTSKKPESIKKLRKFDALSVLELAQKSPKTYYNLVAELSPERYYPLWMNKKQGYFTIVGTAKSFYESAVCEDGMIDAGHKKFSIIPYLYIKGKLITARDTKIKLGLEDKYLPIPIIECKYKNLSFKQKVFAWGEEEKDCTYIWYSLKNNSKKTIKGKLFLTIRPFEVNPPWMSGGLIDIFRIERISEGKIKINNNDILLSLNKIDGFGALSYQNGDIMNFIFRGKLPPYKNAYDPLGGATAALEFKFKLLSNQKQDYFFVIPLGKKVDVDNITQETVLKNFNNTKSYWKKILNKINVKLSNKYIFDVLRSNIAYILINRDGAALQPGSRNYERTWIRDGAEMGVSLLRMGFYKEVKDYINWVIKHQLLPNEELLPMINADGSAWDWGKTLNEYDGQGCFIYLVTEYYRFTKDKKFLKEKFPAVMKAVKFIKYLRKQELRDELKNGPLEKRRFYGLLPISVSHEGYAAPGQHSYWDDYWALKGLKDAGEIALILGKKREYKKIKKEEKDLRKCLLNSIKYAQEYGKFEYIPGSADLGDFDACSLAISVWPTEEAKYLSEDKILYTLDKWYQEVFLPTRMDGIKKIDLTPYEMRIANGYLLLGKKEKALSIFYYYLNLLRPKEWNHWAEVVRYDYRDPHYVGDMPHSWEGAIYINLIRNMLVYEKDNSLVLGAGIDEKWLDRKEGISVKNMPTYFGKISYSMQKKNNVLKIKVTGSAKPKKGFVLKSPFLKKKIKRVKIQGKKWKKFTEKEVFFNKLPAEIVVVY